MHPFRNATKPTWFTELRTRFTFMWPIKAVGTCLFMCVFFWFYFLILRLHNGQAYEVPLTWLDRWVVFTPYSLPVYISLWVYVSLAPAFLNRLRTLINFGTWIALMCMACLVFFWMVPTRVPEFGVDWSQHPAMGIIKGIDAGGNAFPSLHVASAIFSARWLDLSLRQANAPPWSLGLNWIYCAAIAWSTLASLQHVWLDVLSGALVGWLFCEVSIRREKAKQISGGP